MKTNLQKEVISEMYKYHISYVVDGAFIGDYYCIDFSLDTLKGIKKIYEIIQKERSDAVILFFKELKD